MNNNVSQQIVSKAWNFAHVLRDDGLSYMAYTEQITFLLFLKMADEMTKPPYNRAAIVPVKFGWQSLLRYEGDELEIHYRHCLEELGKQSGMLGEIFKKARPDIQNPATLRRLIVDLIEPVKWSSMDADVKGDIYEGLLAKSAEESPKGAGQYFTPRELIKAIVDCVQPTPQDPSDEPASVLLERIRGNGDVSENPPTSSRVSIRIRKSAAAKGASVTTPKIARERRVRK